MAFTSSFQADIIYNELGNYAVLSHLPRDNQLCSGFALSRRQSTTQTSAVSMVNGYYRALWTAKIMYVYTYVCIYANKHAWQSTADCVPVDKSKPMFYLDSCDLSFKWTLWLTDLIKGLIQYKDIVFTSIRIPTVETRRCKDHLISKIGFPILVRHLHIESEPRLVAPTEWLPLLSVF